MSSGRSSMCSGKSVGPKMEPQGTPALTGYSYEDFPCRSTPKLSISEKRQIKAKYLTWNSKRLNFKKTSMSNCIKSCGYIQCYSSGNPRPVQNHSNSIDTTVRKSAVDWEDLKPYGKLENRLHFSGWSASLLFKGSSKTLIMGW